MTRLIQRCIEFREKGEIDSIGKKVRGIYVLYSQEQGGKESELCYVGMSDSNIAQRLHGHKNSKRKKWTHFSVYAVWLNITKTEIQELEGLLRHIYRRDKRANIFNRQRGCNIFRKIRAHNFREWQAKTKQF